LGPDVRSDRARDREVADHGQVHRVRPADLLQIIQSASIQFQLLVRLGLNVGIGGSNHAAMTVSMVPKTTDGQWIGPPLGSAARSALKTVEAITSHPAAVYCGVSEALAGWLNAGR